MDGPDTDIGRGRLRTWSTHSKIHSSGLLVPLSWIFHRSIATPSRYRYPRFIQSLVGTLVFVSSWLVWTTASLKKIIYNYFSLQACSIVQGIQTHIPTIQIQPHKICKKQKNNRNPNFPLSNIFPLPFNIDPPCFPQNTFSTSVRNENRKSREIAGLFHCIVVKLKKKRPSFLSKGLVDRSLIVLLVRRWKIGEGKGGRKGNGRVQQQVRVEELLDPKGCNNGRRNRTGFSSSVLFGRIPDRGKSIQRRDRSTGKSLHRDYFSFFLSTISFFFLLPPFFLFLFLSFFFVSDMNVGSKRRECSVFSFE